MKSFEVENHEASIANVNQRIERHGEERNLAADIKLKLSASNSVLDAFDPSLRHDLFRKPGTGEQQQLPVVGGDGHTEVKHPGIEPLKLKHEFKGFELHIGGLLETIEPIVLVDVKLKKFVIEPKEGGSVDLTFTASALVEPSDLAELSEALIREDVLVTLIAPSRVPETGENLGDGIVDGNQLATGGKGDTLEQQEAAAEAERLKTLGKKKAA